MISIKAINIPVTANSAYIIIIIIFYYNYHYYYYCECFVKASYVCES